MNRKRRKVENIHNHGLFWLFFKRFKFETRKYTAGIILTAGVTALFVSMLVIGSSFLSAFYRATGSEGPSIFSIKYDDSFVNLNQSRPNYMNVTCGISDYYTIRSVRMFYTTDFWESSTIVEGELTHTNLTGFYYHFGISLSNDTTTYLFFIWANNSAGYFSYDDNNGNYYNKRLAFDDGVHPDDLVGVNKPFQKIFIGYDNRTTTRNPRPDISVWSNQSSQGFIILNGEVSPTQSYRDFFVFVLDQDLQVGLNNLTITLLQDNNGTINVYERQLNLTYNDLPPNITNIFPVNESVIYNHMDRLHFVVDEFVSALVRLEGPTNKTWNITSYIRNFSLFYQFNQSYGQYNLDIMIWDRYGGNNNYNLTFQFLLSPYPWITINDTEALETIVNNSIMISCNFSESCNITVENMDVGGSLMSFQNVVSGNFSGIPLIAGNNTINVTAINLIGNMNYTLLHVYKVSYLVHGFDYKQIVNPGSNLSVYVNFSTNGSVSGAAWFSFDHSTNFTMVNFTLLNGTLEQGFLVVSIPVPLNSSTVKFNFSLTFDSGTVVRDNGGNFYHVVVGNYYYDNIGPQNRNLQYIQNPKSVTYNTIQIDLFDISGIFNVTIYYSEDWTFETNMSVDMLYQGTDMETRNGIWSGSIPPYTNGTKVYFKVITFDTLNNSATFGIFSYVVDDSFVNKPHNNIPGVLDINYEKAITGAITTLLTIMVLIIIVFIVIFIALNDQNVKREIYREEDRVFILDKICKLSKKSIKKYYYIEQMIQDATGYVLGSVLGFLFLAPIFVNIVKYTLVEWTFDFHDLFYYSFITLESWVGLLLVLFVLGSLLLKLLQVDKYIEKLGN